MIFNNKCFIHIPRTSGTHIEGLIAGRHKIYTSWPTPNLESLFGLFYDREYSKEKQRWYTLQHLTFLEIQDFILQGWIHQRNYDFFSIIRNPYDRIVSLYHHWGGDLRFGTFDYFLNILDRLEINSYEHKGINVDRGDFNHLNMTDKIRDCKYHFLPQSLYLCDENKKIKAEIIRFGETEKISSKIETPYIFNNDTREKKVHFLNKGRIERIYKLYQVDFENFKYDKKFSLNSKL